MPVAHYSSPMPCWEALAEATPPDKLKADAVAVADAQCQKASVASHGTEPDKTAAVEPEKPASTLPAKPAPTQNSSKSGTPEAAKRDGAEPRIAAGLDGGPSEKNAADLNASEPSDDQEAAAPDGMPSHEAWQGQEPPLPGAGQEGPEVDEWASVMAGTANMRADPSLQSPGLAGARNLAPAWLGAGSGCK